MQIGRFVDPDIRQDGMLLAIPGIAPILMTCSGVCISQPTDSIQTLQFNSVARKAEVKTIKIQNPTDKVIDSSIFFPLPLSLHLYQYLGLLFIYLFVCLFIYLLI